MLGLDVVIDVSHHNGNIDFKAVKNSGIVAVIHKATQGLHHVDDMYAHNKAAANAQGLLVGAYHFGTEGDGAAQADYFLSIAGKDVLHVLDFEYNEAEPHNTMAFNQAKTFIRRIKEVTGKYPVLYGGVLIRMVLGVKMDSDFAACKLWLAQYGPKTTIPVAWKNYTLWQYTDQGHIAGIQTTVDRSRFAGNLEDLKKFWKTQ
jgi:lysozyme